MFVFSDTTYNLLKRLVQVFLPALSALYFGLAQIWGFPNAEQVVGTIAVLTTFLGVSLGISTATYEKSGAAYDGKLLITPTEDKTIMSLELNEDAGDLQGKDSIRFKVCEHHPE